MLGDIYLNWAFLLYITDLQPFFLGFNGQQASCPFRSPVVAEGGKTTGRPTGGPGAPCWHCLTVYQLRLIVAPPRPLGGIMQIAFSHKVTRCWQLLFQVWYKTPSKSWPLYIDCCPNSGCSSRACKGHSYHRVPSSSCISLHLAPARLHKMARGRSPETLHYTKAMPVNSSAFTPWCLHKPFATQRYNQNVNPGGLQIEGEAYPPQFIGGSHKLLRKLFIKAKRNLIFFTQSCQLTFQKFPLLSENLSGIKGQAFDKYQYTTGTSQHIARPSEASPIQRQRKSQIE